jgi:hypothetical protein
VYELRLGDAVEQMKGRITMAACDFRVNAERLGVDLENVTTWIHWEGGEFECRFVIEAPASEVTLSLALGKAAHLTGLRAEQFSNLRAETPDQSIE